MCTGKMRYDITPILKVGQSLHLFTYIPSCTIAVGLSQYAPVCHPHVQVPKRRCHPDIVTRI